VDAAKRLLVESGLQANPVAWAPLSLTIPIARYRTPQRAPSIGALPSDPALFDARNAYRKPSARLKLAGRHPGKTLYPSEAVIARWVLGDRSTAWPAKAVLLERLGLPKIDPLMGGRFWPAVKVWFLRRHGLDTSAKATMPTHQRIRAVPFAPDGEADFDGEKAQAARRQRRDRRPRAPGLDIRERENGTRDLYWIATVQSRKRGYLPRTVRLHYDLANPMDRRELI
jgi:hypothetical protein